MKKVKDLKKKAMDQELLNKIFTLKDEWTNLESIMSRSVEPSEEGQYELAISKAKYLYLIREAKIRNISAL
ncbi:hypothetical protein GGQ92_002227 [Gracilibacillus halotolerans]|uniref:DUF2508 domain-containing protein n=1 Tax=Gracilibacillus halotolerans TaxID=74386 RepID=A0A841RLQ3_9BACI|nr:YaaL family protein [Gracilibacillus halotolerans]MBB6513419.1 hypothetical protein [Gracilibacillus halotolerans]